MRIGILGSGQLARMMALAGYPLGLQFRIFGPEEEPCAAIVAEHIQAEYNDLEALERFAQDLDVVTFEFENVPAATADFLEQNTKVRPAGKALLISQDRLKEKQYLQDLDIPVAPFVAVDNMEQLRDGLGTVGYPAILKTRCLGYDGKGQAIIRLESEIASAYQSVEGAPCILEGLVDFDRELSLICVRSTEGQIVYYSLCENWHREGILRKTVAPATNVSSELQQKAERYARKLVEELGYVGVLTIEFFQVGDNLLVNEIAPRVHNSGHWSIEGAVTSQFENHVRAVAGLPLGSTENRSNCLMLNCIGNMPDRRAILQIPGAHYHAYGKMSRARRKVGHITMTLHDMADSVADVERVAALLESSEETTVF